MPDKRRPQDPVPPFPYTEENVTYENTAAKIKLAGTLTLPKSDGPVPAVLLISGSGPQDRDEALMGHRPFLVLADYLTRTESPSCESMTAVSEARRATGPPRPRKIRLAMRWWA